MAAHNLGDHDVESCQGIVGALGTLIAAHAWAAWRWLSTWDHMP